MSSKSDLCVILKGVLQFLFGALLSFAAFKLYIWSGTHRLSVESWIEIGQETLLGLAAIIFYFCAGRRTDLRSGLLLVAGFLTCLFIRELDAYLDDISHGSWKYLVIVFLCVLTYLISRTGVRTVLPGLSHFIGSRSFTYMVAGMVLLLAFSRLYGIKELWELYCAGAPIWKQVKSFAEESIELLGYMFIFSSSVAYAFEIRRSSFLK